MAHALRHPASSFLARHPTGEPSLMPSLFTLGLGLLGLSWVVAEWSSAEVVGVIAAVVSGVVTILGAIGALAAKLLAELRQNRKATVDQTARTAQAARAGASDAVTRAIDASALPTTDAQRAEFLRDLAAEVRRQEAAAAAQPPRVQT